MELGGGAAREKLEELPVEYVSYDGGPLYDDYELLKRWWERRIASGHSRAVLYYDSMTLHVGVQGNLYYQGHGGEWIQLARDLYPEKVVFGPWK